MRLSDEALARIELALRAADEARADADAADLQVHALKTALVREALPPGTVVRVVGWLKDRPDELRAVVTDWPPEGALLRVMVQFLTHPSLGEDGLQETILSIHHASRQPLVYPVSLDYLEPTEERAPYWHHADMERSVFDGVKL